MVKSSSINADMALQSGKSEDDLGDILALLDRVKSKRERLKKIGLKHRNQTGTGTTGSNASPAASPARGSPTLQPRSSPSPSSASPVKKPMASCRASLRRKEQRSSLQPPLSSRSTIMTLSNTPAKYASQTDQTDRIFQDIMSSTTTKEYNNNEENESNNHDHLEEGELVDVDLNCDHVEAIKDDQNEHKRVWITRILAMEILSATIIVVLVFVLGIPRRAENDVIPSSEQQLVRPPPIVLPSNETYVTVADISSNSTQWSQKCFQTTDILEAAVLAYLKNPSPNSEIAQEYGYPIGIWCVSNITNFHHIFSVRGKAFQHLYEEFNEPLDGWDTSSAVSFEGMFDGARNFNQDISMWNVSQVSDFRACFRGCDAFDQDLSIWDVRSMNRAEGMFEKAKSFRGLGLGNWTTSALSGMDRMFQGASAFIGEGIGSWNISGVESMLDTFRDAVVFNEDLHLWRFSPSFHRFPALFQGCTSFNGRLDGWNIEDTHVRSLERLFYGASSFNQPLDWNVSKIERFDKAFSGATNFNQDLDWDTTFAYQFDEMFMDAVSFNSSIANWDMSHAETVTQMFRGATSFDQPLNWNFAVVKDMSFMFADALSFNQDLYWKTQTVKDMSGMFANAQKFNGDISSWDVSQVQTMDLMFRDAVSFNQELPWDLGNVREMGGILWGASSFNQSLCDWSHTLTLRSSSTTDEMITADSILSDLFGSSHTSLPLDHRLFEDSGCPDPSTPTYLQFRFIGPFCHTCTYSALEHSP